MKWLYSEEHIFLKREDIEKVAKLLEKELGITNIKAINANPESFEIVRLCFDQNDSLASNIMDVNTIKSVKAFKDFCERYNSKE